MTATEELFLPEPLPREVKYTVISVDDHVVEPPHTFEGRLPAHLQDRAPKVHDTPQGKQIWVFEDELYTQAGMNAIAGRRPSSNPEPARFDEMLDRVRAADVTIVMGGDGGPGADTTMYGEPAGGRVKSAFLRDPEGNYVQLDQRA